MPSEENYRYSRRPSARIVSIAHAQKSDHHILTMCLYLLAGAVVALGFANLPAWTGSLLALLNVLPAHLT
jgi:hypothetical protein